MLSLDDQVAAVLGAHDGEGDVGRRRGPVQLHARTNARTTSMLFCFQESRFLINHPISLQFIGSHLALRSLFFSSTYSSSSSSSK